VTFLPAAEICTYDVVELTVRVMVGSGHVKDRMKFESLVKVRPVGVVLPSSPKSQLNVREDAGKFKTSTRSAAVLCTLTAVGLGVGCVNGHRLPWASEVLVIPVVGHSALEVQEALIAHHPQSGLLASEMQAGQEEIISQA
jgi:hypothetical protein